MNYYILEVTTVGTNRVYLRVNVCVSMIVVFACLPEHLAFLLHSILLDFPLKQRFIYPCLHHTLFSFSSIPGLNCLACQGAGLQSQWSKGNKIRLTFNDPCPWKDLMSACLFRSEAGLCAALWKDQFIQITKNYFPFICSNKRSSSHKFDHYPRLL